MSSHILKPTPESKLPWWQPPTWKVLLPKHPYHSCLLSLCFLSCFFYICLLNVFPLHSYSFFALYNSQNSPFPLTSICSKVSPEFPSQISIFHWISPHGCPISTLNSTEPKLDTLLPALPTYSTHCLCNLSSTISDHLPTLDTWKSSPISWLLPPQLPHTVTQSPSFTILTFLGVSSPRLSQQWILYFFTLWTGVIVT